MRDRARMSLPIVLSIRRSSRCQTPAACALAPAACHDFSDASRFHPHFLQFNDVVATFLLLLTFGGDNDDDSTFFARPKLPPQSTRTRHHRHILCSAAWRWRRWRCFFIICLIPKNATTPRSHHQCIAAQHPSLRRLHHRLSSVFIFRGRCRHHRHHRRRHRGNTPRGATHERFCPRR